MPAIWFLLSGVCHQIPERSLHLQGAALPLCARCMGLFPAMLLGLLTLWASRQGPRTGLPRGLTLGCAVALILAWSADGLNAFVAQVSGSAGWWASSNAVRLATGTGCGLAFSMFVYPVYQFVARGHLDPRPVLTERWRLALMLGVGGAWMVLGLTWTSAPRVLMSWALALAVVACLGLVNGLLAILLLRRVLGDGRPETGWLPWAIGVAAGLLEMSLMALVRRWWA